MRSRDTEFYVGMRFKVGIGQNYNALTMRQKNGAWYKPTHFRDVCGYSPIDNPRDSETVLMRDISQKVKEYTNDVIENPELCRDKESPYAMYGHSTIRMLDKRGFEYRIAISNFLNILNTHDVVDGKIIGKFVFAISRYWSDNNLYLLDVDSEEYKSKSEFEKDVLDEKKTLEKTQLEFGKVYKLYETASIDCESYVRAVYLGRWTNVNSNINLPYALTPYYLKTNRSAIKESIEKHESGFASPRYVFAYLNDGFNEYDTAILQDSNDPSKVKFVEKKQRYSGSGYEYVDTDNYGLPSEKCIRSLRVNNIECVAENNKFKIRGLDENQTIQIDPTSHKRSRFYYYSSDRLGALKAYKGCTFEFPVYTAEELSEAVVKALRHRVETSYLGSDRWSSVGSMPTLGPSERIPEEKIKKRKTKCTSTK